MENNVFVRYKYTFHNWKSIDVYLYKECRGPNYGYGCNESCQCVRGICNRNATNVNQSCTCNAGYQSPFCIKLIDACGKNISFIDYERNALFFSANNMACNFVTEDCATDPNNGSAICTCKLGYERHNITGVCTGRNNHWKKAFAWFMRVYICTDIDECANNADICDAESSFCNNGIGNYSCNCKPGYQVWKKLLFVKDKIVHWFCCLVCE